MRSRMLVLAPTTDGESYLITPGSPQFHIWSPRAFNTLAFPPAVCRAKDVHPHRTAIRLQLRCVDHGQATDRNTFPCPSFSRSCSFTRVPCPTLDFQLGALGRHCGTVTLSCFCSNMKDQSSPVQPVTTHPTPPWFEAWITNSL